MTMQITGLQGSAADLYNGPAGKVDLTGFGTISYVTTGITATGAVNVASGITFSRGTDLPTGKYFGHSDTWAKLVSDAAVPVYVKYVAPTGGFPVSGCMISVYAEFEGSQASTWDGLGEIAVYAKFSTDESDIRLLMFMGLPQGGQVCQPGGWMVPGDTRSQAFVIHDRNVFSELPGLVGKKWSDIKELRLVFRNQTANKKVRIRNWYIYEAIRKGPYGKVISVNATPASATLNLAVSGATGTTPGLLSGICSADMVFDTTLTSVTGRASYGVPATVLSSIAFTSLPVASRSRFLVMHDTYGNYSYIDNSWGVQTLPTGSFSGSANYATGRISFTGSIDGEALNVHSYALYQWGRPKDSNTLDYVPVVVKTYSPPVSVPLAISEDLPLDKTAGGQWKLVINGERTHHDVFPNGSSRDCTYFYTYTAYYVIPDQYPPTISFDLATAQSTVRATTVARDMGGIGRIEYIRANTDGSETTVQSKAYTGPDFPTSVVDDAIIPATPGSQISIRARVWDAAGNWTDSEMITLRVRSGGGYSGGGSTVKPEISAIPLSNGHVKISWSSWEGFLDATGAVAFEPTVFQVYRRQGDAAAYAKLSPDLPASTREYLDTTITVPGIYQYLVQGKDNLGNRKSISATVDVSSAPTVTLTTFVEDYLQLLPKWTAAIPKNPVE